MPKVGETFNFLRSVYPSCGLFRCPKAPQLILLRERQYLLRCPGPAVLSKCGKAFAKLVTSIYLSDLGREKSWSSEDYTSYDVFLESLNDPQILAALLPQLFGSASSKSTHHYQRTNVVQCTPKRNLEFFLRQPLWWIR